MLPLAIWVATSVIGFVREVPRERVVRDACEGCGYSLSGLAPEGVCPECGGAFAGNGTMRRVQHGWRLTLIRPGLMLFTLVFVMVVGVWPELAQASILRWIEAEVLIHRGYRPDVAWRAVTLAPSYGWGYGRHGGALAPQALGAAFMPLLGRLRGRWAWCATIAVSVVTVGGAISLWARSILLLW